MDACDLFGQNNDLKVNIMGMGYVPDSGITMHVILPLVFPLNSPGFKAMTYRKKKFPLNLGNYIRFWVGISLNLSLLDFKIGITFFLIFVKTEHIFFSDKFLQKYWLYAIPYQKVQIVWIVLVKIDYMLCKDPYMAFKCSFGFFA